MTRLVLALLASLCLAPLARAETEVQETTATIDARPWEGEFGLEMAGNRTVTYQGHLHATYRLPSSWKTGFETEAETVTEEGVRTNNWNEALLFVGNDGFDLGDALTLELRAIAMTPTLREERAAGLGFSPGASASLEFAPTDRWKFTYELKGYRLLRNSEKAEFRADPEGPTLADGLDRWQVENELGAEFRIYRDLWLSGSAKHSLNWKWAGGREALVELEQAITYEWGKWSFGAGHRLESLVREANGDSHRIALASSKDSVFFGSLSVTL
jgi:hypothetical protein